MTRKAALIVLMLGALCLGVAASAALAAAPSPLTAQEYQELSALKSAYTNIIQKPTRASVETYFTTCNGLQVVSTLTGAERRACRATEVELFQSGLVAKAETRCGKAKNPEARATCLTPSFRSYYIASDAEYRSHVAVNDAAVSRGLGSQCVDYIGEPAPVVRLEKLVVADLHAELEALEHHNEPGVARASKRLTHAVIKELGETFANPGAITACPEVSSTTATTSTTTTGTTTSATTTTSTTTTQTTTT